MMKRIGRALAAVASALVLVGVGIASAAPEQPTVPVCRISELASSCWQPARSAPTAGDLVWVSNSDPSATGDARCTDPAEAGEARLLALCRYTGSTWVAADIATQSTGGSGGTPGGSNTQVQFNNSDEFGGDADLTWNPSTNLLSINGNAIFTNALGGFQWEGGAQPGKYSLGVATGDPASGTVAVLLDQVTTSGYLVTNDSTQTLTNKTLTAAANDIGADTAVALAANGANCATATHFAVGVDASGAAECEAIAEEDVPVEIARTSDILTASQVVRTDADSAIGLAYAGPWGNWSRKAFSCVNEMIDLSTSSTGTANCVLQTRVGNNGATSNVGGIGAGNRIGLRNITIDASTASSYSGVESTFSNQMAVGLSGLVSSFVTAFNVSNVPDGTDDYIIRWGWIDTNLSGADTTDGCYFAIDRAISTTNYLIGCKNAGTGTPAATGTAFSGLTTTKDFQIDCTSSLCTFYVEGSSIGTVSTNIPTSSNTHGWGIQFVRVGTPNASRTVQIDYLGYRLDLGTAR